MSEKELYPTNGVKKPWQSKTLWVNAIMAVAAFFPSAVELISPEAVGTVFLFVNTVLRFATSKKISVE